MPPVVSVSYLATEATFIGKALSSHSEAQGTRDDSAAGQVMLRADSLARRTRGGEGH